MLPKRTKPGMTHTVLWDPVPNLFWKNTYWTFGLLKIVDIGTLSFRWILPFWYFCFLWWWPKLGSRGTSLEKVSYRNIRIHLTKQGCFGRLTVRATCCKRNFFKNFSKNAVSFLGFCGPLPPAPHVSQTKQKSWQPSEIFLYSDPANLSKRRASQILTVCHKCLALYKILNNWVQIYSRVIYRILR